MPYELILLRFRASISESAYNLIVVQVKQVEPEGPKLGKRALCSDRDSSWTWCEGQVAARCRRTDKHSYLPQRHKCNVRTERRDVPAGLQNISIGEGSGVVQHTTANCIECVMNAYN
jgi:hypothetical protein